MDSVDGNNNEKQHQDLKQRFEKLARYVHYMEKFREEIVLSDSTIRTVNITQSNKLPQLVRCVRTEYCIVMQLSSNTVQVNFMPSWRIMSRSSSVGRRRRETC